MTHFIFFTLSLPEFHKKCQTKSFENMNTLLSAIFNSLTDIHFFLNMLNNQHPNIHFTCEEASRPSLPFLDVEVTICDTELSGSEYRKQTFTGVLFHFNSIAPLFWKRGLITCLLHRGYLYSLNDSLLKTKINFVISLFNRNGYPISFTLNEIDKFKNKFNHHSKQFPR